MPPDPELLTRLLRGERVPPAPAAERRVLFAELARHLAGMLRRGEGPFPRPWVEPVAGEAIWEGGVIERLPSGRYRYRSQRHHAIDPTSLAERFEREFGSAEAAARHYLQVDLGLPGRLGGWTVEPEPWPARLLAWIREAVA